MSRVQESLEPAISDTESIFQEYKERISQALETHTKILKEKAEEDSIQIIARANEEAKQITRKSHEDAAEAQQESARVISETREKASQIIKEVIETSTKQAQSEFSRAASEVRSKTSQLLDQVSKSVEQIIGETETHIKAELESLATLIADAETKLQQLSAIPDKEAEVNWRYEIEEAVTPAPSANEETEPSIPSPEDKRDVLIKEVDDTRLFKGSIKLELVPPFNQERFEGVPHWLARITGLKVISSDVHAGANRWITTYTVDLEQPMPLLKILKAVPQVKNVAEHKGNIVITLK